MSSEITSPAMKMVAFFTDGNEARSAQSALADENIPCIIVNSPSGPAPDGISGFRLLVTEHNAEAAQALLTPNVSVYYPEEYEPADEIIRTHSLSWYIALFLAILAVIGFATTLYTH